jgi:hypothetical protein
MPEHSCLHVTFRQWTLNIESREQLRILIPELHKNVQTVVWTVRVHCLRLVLVLGKNAQNFPAARINCCLVGENLEEPLCLLDSTNISETTIGSPLASCPLSLAPKGPRTREWRRSQSCRTGKCLLNLQKKVTCIRYHLESCSQASQKHKIKLWTSNTPGEHQVCCHCYSEGCQPGRQCRNASSQTLDANREDLNIYKISVESLDNSHHVPELWNSHTWSKSMVMKEKRCRTEWSK